MSDPVSKVTNGVKTAAALVSVLGVSASFSDQHGDVESVKLLWLIPVFRRDGHGRARIFGFRAKRLDRAP